MRAFVGNLRPEEGENMSTSSATVLAAPMGMVCSQFAASQTPIPTATSGVRNFDTGVVAAEMTRGTSATGPG